MSNHFIGFSFQILGEVMIGVTVILVHRRVRKEHKIDRTVYQEMSREQTIGILGIILLIVGYFMQILWK